MHHSSGRWRLGLALSLLTVFLWGILPLALKVVLQALDVYTVIWFRFLLSFALLAVYLGMRGNLPKLKQLQANSWKLLAIATLMLASNYFLFMQGLALTSPANAEVIIQLATLLFGFGGLIVFQERYNFFQWLGVGVLTLGYVLFFRSQLTNVITSHDTYVFGSALVVLGAVAWAIYALAQKQLLQSLSSAQIMLVIYGGCTLLFTPFTKFEAFSQLSNLHLLTLLFCALNTVIAYGAFAESLEHWEASRVSAVLALAPIITLIAVELISLIAPNLIPPERLTTIGIVGACLVVSGSVAIALKKSS
ncbi:DMT family transporter [Nostoc parmelioides]|uniref:DMT family transporter n=1 Tax=Nostoc parmelioides FACHB-3921 TaxID=2692909 RepID=A0ABR8BPX5_9NOSO|nr:DMT family transporter [Nostoc parmelioides]MBD2255916.1 DMT family transporter [Nostoc parmelioides FACHB-3921]